MPLSNFWRPFAFNGRNGRMNEEGFEVNASKCKANASICEHLKNWTASGVVETYEKISIFKNSKTELQKRERVL